MLKNEIWSIEILNWDFIVTEDTRIFGPIHDSVGQLLVCGAAQMNLKRPHVPKNFILRRLPVQQKFIQRVYL